MSIFQFFKQPPLKSNTIELLEPLTDPRTKATPLRRIGLKDELELYLQIINSSDCDSFFRRFFLLEPFKPIKNIAKVTVSVENLSKLQARYLLSYQTRQEEILAEFFGGFPESAVKTVVEADRRGWVSIGLSKKDKNRVLPIGALIFDFELPTLKTETRLVTAAPQAVAESWARRLELPKPLEISPDDFRTIDDLIEKLRYPSLANLKPEHILLAVSLLQDKRRYRSLDPEITAALNHFLKLG